MEDYPPAVDYPPTQAAPLPGYQPSQAPPPAGYPPSPAAGYPPPNPPLGYTPPGYQPYGVTPPGLPGYGNAAAYPPPAPMPGPYGSPPVGYYPDLSYGGGYGAMQAGTNTMAIVSLVSAIVGVFCCIGAIVGVVCGIVGINQIKQTHEEGFGLAVAGIVISVATMLVYFIAVMFSIGSH